MKAKTLLILALCASIPAMACAQKKKKGQPEPAPVQEEEQAIVTEDCVMYTSLFHESAKNKQFADAYEPWKLVYETCPSYSTNVYVDGDKIIEWKMKQYAVGSAEYNEFRALLMTLHDKRIKYFGDHAKYPKGYILGQKGLDYCEFFPEDELHEAAYPWLKESVQLQGSKSLISVVNKLAEVSLALYKSDAAKYAEQYIADYQLCADALSAMAADASNKSAANAKAQKDYLDNVFATSGAADCATLDQLYAQTVQDNVDNLDMLGKLMTLYRRVRCTESDVYFAAAEASHKLSPTAESAAGCAAMSFKKGDYKAAVDYFDQAIEMSDNNEDKADYYYRSAAILFSQMKSYAQARNYLRKAIELNGTNGSYYILMAHVYASAQPYSKEDVGAKAGILNKTVYWVAVDKLVKAKQVDPSCAEEAQKFISTYSKYFPSKEERFDLPGEFSGSTFTVGGWVGETTTIR